MRCVAFIRDQFRVPGEEKYIRREKPFTAHLVLVGQHGSHHWVRGLLITHCHLRLRALFRLKVHLDGSRRGSNEKKQATTTRDRPLRCQNRANGARCYVTNGAKLQSKAMEEDQTAKRSESSQSKTKVIAKEFWEPGASWRLRVGRGGCLAA